MTIFFIVENQEGIGFLSPLSVELISAANYASARFASIETFCSETSSCITIFCWINAISTANYTGFSATLIDTFLEQAFTVPTFFSSHHYILGCLVGIILREISFLH